MATNVGAPLKDPVFLSYYSPAMVERMEKSWKLDPANYPAVKEEAEQVGKGAKGAKGSSATVNKPSSPPETCGCKTCWCSEVLDQVARQVTFKGNSSVAVARKFSRRNFN